MRKSFPIARRSWRLVERRSRIVWLILSFATQALAAETDSVIAYQGGRFALRQAPTGDCVIALQGNVTEDSAFRFADVVRKASDFGCARPMTLLLESPGGDLFNGISLAYQVEALAFRTVARYECASACALIFLAGAERVLWGSRARIGFHQSARVGQRMGERIRRCDTSIDRASVVRIRRYLYRRFAAADDAERIYRIIMETSCNAIEWIQGQRAIELRVATELASEGIDVFGPKEQR